MVNKMIAPLVCGAMQQLKENYPEEYNKNVDNANYILTGKLKSPFFKLKNA